MRADDLVCVCVWWGGGGGRGARGARAKTRSRTRNAHITCYSRPKHCACTRGDTLTSNLMQALCELGTKAASEKAHVPNNTQPPWRAQKNSQIPITERFWFGRPPRRPRRPAAFTKLRMAPWATSWRSIWPCVGSGLGHEGPRRIMGGMGRKGKTGEKVHKNSTPPRLIRSESSGIDRHPSFRCAVREGRHPPGCISTKRRL